MYGDGSVVSMIFDPKKRKRSMWSLFESRGINKGFLSGALSSCPGERVVDFFISETVETIRPLTDGVKRCRGARKMQWPTSASKTIHASRNATGNYDRDFLRVLMPDGFGPKTLWSRLSPPGTDNRQAAVVFFSWPFVFKPVLTGIGRPFCLLSAIGTLISRTPSFISALM